MEEKEEVAELSVLRAILALLIDQRARDVMGSTSVQPVETILAAAGLEYRVIADLVGKKPDAVRMMLRRSKQ
jgi:hypothetical protein